MLALSMPRSRVSSSGTETGGTDGSAVLPGVATSALTPGTSPTAAPPGKVPSFEPESVMGRMMHRAITTSSPPPASPAMAGLALQTAASLENSPCLRPAASSASYDDCPRAGSCALLLTPATTCSRTGTSPLRARRSAPILGKRSSVFTASAFNIACSMCRGMMIPSSDGALSASTRMRSTESGGSMPVMQR